MTIFLKAEVSNTHHGDVSLPSVWSLLNPFLAFSSFLPSHHSAL